MTSPSQVSGLSLERDRFAGAGLEPFFFFEIIFHKIDVFRDP